MKATNVKSRQIKSTIDDEQDYFDNLIRIDRDAYRPNPVGRKVHMSLCRTRVLRGGLGSGKSRTACEQINQLCLEWPGATCLIGRKDMTALKETTQKEFLEKVVDSSLIDQFNVNENKLFYKNGSTVLFRETKFPDKVKSMELTAYLLDEADENDTAEIWEKIDERLRQKIKMGGEWLTPPYCGMIVLNPCNEEHWIHALAHRRDISLEDFKFSTYDNIDHLPPDYIPNLLKRLAPWDVDRLVHGNWGRVIKGLPVYHGFRRERHVRGLAMRPDLPLLVGWDFGFNHPAIVWCQQDPKSGRLFVLREYYGTQQMLQDTPEKPGVVSCFQKITKELVGPTPWPIFHFGDPHGNDKKDSGLSSIEYLRVHHSIHVASQRTIIKTGIDEIQHKLVTDALLSPRQPELGNAPLLLIDPSCKKLILSIEGGYHRDPVTGDPVKDDEFDHLPDSLRYVVVNQMGAHIKHRFKKTKYVPRSSITGY